MKRIFLIKNNPQFIFDKKPGPGFRADIDVEI